MAASGINTIVIFLNGQKPGSISGRKKFLVMIKRVITSITQLLQLMQSHGATRFYAKKLSPNDNSKNQIYLGGNFSALNIIPFKDIYIDDSDLVGSKRERAKADVSFYWIRTEGKYKAPDAQLILYSKYPEVRMSGFLKGCKNAPSDIMSIRDEGRVLFLGITHNGEVLGYATGSHHPLSKELYTQDRWETLGVFIEIPPDTNKRQDTKSQLLFVLKRIYEKQWIASQKMSINGLIEPYSARNGGGYTLEAELGISPNGHSEPDYLGWEIKQYGVADFIKFSSKSPVTLMTPEPTGGIYQDAGIVDFIRKFGYADKSGKVDRINFGGIYACNKDYHNGTGLRLGLDGYDSSTGKITDMSGGMLLISRKEEIAAQWGFVDIMQHWNRKHSQAAYVPSLFRTPPPEYYYGAKVLLCEQTDFSLFLKAVASGIIYYDPGIKIEGCLHCEITYSQNAFVNSIPKLKTSSRLSVRNILTMGRQLNAIGEEFALRYLSPLDNIRSDNLDNGILGKTINKLLKETDNINDHKIVKEVSQKAAESIKDYYERMGIDAHYTNKREYLLRASYEVLRKEELRKHLQSKINITDIADVKNKEVLEDKLERLMAIYSRLTNKDSVFYIPEEINKVMTEFNNKEIKLKELAMEYQKQGMSYNKANMIAKEVIKYEAKKIKGNDEYWEQ
ncbi:hypothetical protein RFI_38615 [Reticulomyxa filosa]|uniref:MvaI/BcnI restriction endonuclease domain-containing protein n=1 Tax=Reticulomyxa filosa TaxID=46433 RepID=X6LA41_RETFI|nr:hypothetical protein RFI_38615 [Reticulomyxa filosa]|eukprot:ETN98872.1 hypothetical protein RFI_38615 [Reticulomyxa filosa]